MKKFALLLVALVAAAGLCAQTPGITCYNNPNIYNPEIRSLSPTTDGGFIAHSGSGQSCKALKYNSAYQVTWSYEIQNLFFRDNVETKDGNYVFVAVNYNLASVHVFKFTPAGVLLWEKVYSTPGGFLDVNGIAPASGTDNGFIFFGGMSSQVMHYVTKCDAGGNVVWSKQYTNMPGPGSISSVITEPTGYVAAGWYGMSQVYYAVVLRLDTAGNLSAAQQYSANTSLGGLEVQLNSLVPLANGNYFLWTHPQQLNGTVNFALSNSLNVTSCNLLSDSSGIFVDAVPTNNAGEELLMPFSYFHNLYGGFVVISPTGTISSQKYSLSGGIIPHDGVRFTNGNTLLGGYVGAQNHYGSMLCLTDDAGNGMCDPMDATYSVQQNYPHTTFPLALVTSSFNLVVAADTFSLDTITFLPFNICGYLTGTSSVTEISGLLSCFPNPSRGVTTVQLPSTMNLDGITLQLFDGNGRRIETRSGLESNTVEFRMQTAGIYFVLLCDRNGNTIGSTRFVQESE